MPSNEYTVGDQPTLTATFAAAAGTPVDPTAVTITVHKPNGTTVNPSPAHVSTGVYQVTVFLDTPGVWKWKAVGTGAAVAASRPEDGTFRVVSQSF